MVAFFFIGLIYSVFRFSKDYKRYKGYVSFTNSFEIYSVLNIVLQLNLQGIIHFHKEVPSDFSFSSAFYWICLAGTFISFFAIIIAPFVLKHAIDDTERLKAIYES